MSLLCISNNELIEYFLISFLIESSNLSPSVLHNSKNWLFAINQTNYLTFFYLFFEEFSLSKSGWTINISEVNFLDYSLRYLYNNWNCISLNISNPFLFKYSKPFLDFVMIISSRFSIIIVCVYWRFNFSKSS